MLESLYQIFVTRQTITINKPDQIAYIKNLKHGLILVHCSVKSLEELRELCLLLNKYSPHDTMLVFSNSNKIDFIINYIFNNWSRMTIPVSDQNYTILYRE